MTLDQMLASVAVASTEDLQRGARAAATLDIAIGSLLLVVFAAIAMGLVLAAKWRSLSATQPIEGTLVSSSEQRTRICEGCLLIGTDMVERRSPVTRYPHTYCPTCLPDVCPDCARFDQGVRKGWGCTWCEHDVDAGRL